MTKLNILLLLAFVGLISLSSSTFADPGKSMKHSTATHSKTMKSSQMKARHGIRAIKASKENPSTAETVKYGKWLYGVYCNHCHGLKGEGDGPAAKYLETKPANLTKLATRFPDHHFFLQIALGKGKMPTWGDTLEEKELWALSHYIQTLGPAKKNK